MDGHNFDSAEGSISTDIAESRSTNSSGESDEESCISYDRVLEVESEAELQECSGTTSNHKKAVAMAEVNSKPGRKTTEEFEENPNNLLEFPTHLDGGHEHGTHSSNSTDLIPENDDDMVGHASTLHDELQQKIDLLQEKLQQKENEIQQLLAELGRLEFLECREKRIEKSSRAHLGEQSKSSTVDGASCALTDVKENLLHWTGPPQELSYEDNGGRMSGVNWNRAANIASESSKDTADDMSTNADCNDSSAQSEESSPEVFSGAVSVPAYRQKSTQTNEWEQLGARPKERPPLWKGSVEPTGPVVPNVDGTPSQDGEAASSEETHCASENASSNHLSITGDQVASREIDEPCCTKSETRRSSLPGASYMERMLNHIESNRAEPYPIGCQVASSPDERRSLRFSLSPPVSMGANEEGEAVGGSAFNVLANGNTGLVPSITAGSNGADSQLLLEATASGETQCAPGNASSSQSSITGDQVASREIDEPCCTESETRRSSLPGASYMERMLNHIESNRAEPYPIGCQVASSPDERRSLRFSLSPPVSMGANEKGEAMGGSAFNEPLNRNAEVVPASTPNSSCQPPASTGNFASVDAENLPSSCSVNLLNTTDNQVASQAVAEPCHITEPVLPNDNSDESMLDRNTEDESADATINAALLALAQRIQEACAHVEREREEREREREGWERANRRLQGQVVGSNSEVPVPMVDYTADSLDSIHNSASAFQQGVARARALARIEAAAREEVNRRWCRCTQPAGEKLPICRQCLKNRYMGPSSPSGHAECCYCLQDDSFGSSLFLPCAHKVHSECVIAMIQNGILDCPICGHPFLRRG